MSLRAYESGFAEKLTAKKKSAEQERRQKSRA
jgi:hypothetical protein